MTPAYLITLAALALFVAPLFVKPGSVRDGTGRWAAVRRAGRRVAT